MDPSTLQHSSSIPSWIPCSPLGSGSFGHVSLALNLHNSSLFAVKSPLSSSPGPELLALQNELLILQSLHSPFIIQCLGAEFSPTTDSSQPTLRSVFLEYMDGGSLADSLKKSGGILSDSAQVRRFTRSVLHGLAYLHENGIVHGDIKSQNILTGSSGVKIADFGTARRVGEVSTMGRNLRGTPLWMAPEVALGGEPIPASDVWSLGCTVVEMLQGRPPWGAVSSVAAALFKVGCSSEIPPLPDLISAEAKDFLLKCLKRDPNARWTAAELLNHPFLCGLEEIEGEGSCRKKEQPSPRSTLDFIHIDSESDEEEELFFSIGPAVPMLCFLPRKTTGLISSPLVKFSKESHWIVVKSSERWCEERQLPFMQAGVERELEALQVRRVCEVSFASAEFLKNRRVKRIVG